MVDESFFNGCGLYYDGARRELWAYGKESGTVWVYGLDSEAWYSFTEIFADLMLELNGCAAFIKDGKLYIFDDGYSTDILEDGSERIIQSVYVSNGFDFGSAENKNFSLALFRGDLHYGNAVIGLTADGGDEVRYTLSDAKNYEHSVIKKRLCSRRFKRGRLAIYTSSGCGQVIRGVTLYAR